MLEGKTILVFGAGGRIGWGASESIWNHGANVVAVDLYFNDHIKGFAEETVKHDRIIKLQILDVCNKQQLVGFFDTLTKIDGVVNCSYPKGNNYGVDFLDIDIDDFNETITKHLGSVVHLSQLCVRHFRKHPYQMSVVNFSSIYGNVAPKFDIYKNVNFTVPAEYAVMKASIQHLNKYISSYVKDSRFRINTISPGGILDGHSEEFQLSYREKTRGHGLLQVSDILGAIIFLLSDQSYFITAQNLIIDDGFTL